MMTYEMQRQLLMKIIDTLDEADHINQRLTALHNLEKLVRKDVADDLALSECGELFASLPESNYVYKDNSHYACEVSIFSDACNFFPDPMEHTIMLWVRYKRLLELEEAEKARKCAVENPFAALHQFSEMLASLNRIIVKEVESVDLRKEEFDKFYKKNSSKPAYRLAEYLFNSYEDFQEAEELYAKVLLLKEIKRLIGEAELLMSLSGVSAQSASNSAQPTYHFENREIRAAYDYCLATGVFAEVSYNDFYMAAEIPDFKTLFDAPATRKSLLKLLLRQLATAIQNPDGTRPVTLQQRWFEDAAASVGTTKTGCSSNASKYEEWTKGLAKAMMSVSKNYCGITS